MIVAPVAAVICAALVFAAAAGAAGEYEQNDSRDSAYGPLAGGVDYTATFETDNDVDWYVFYIKTYSQMDISASEVTNCDFEGVRINLLDKDGKYTDSFYAGAVNEVEHLRLTMNPGRYYLEIKNPGCRNDSNRHRFRIEPAAAVTTSRECGEAIVARNFYAPEVARLAGEQATQNQSVARATKAVRHARASLNRLRKRQAPGYRRRNARRRLEAAKAALAKEVTAKAGIDSLVGQTQQALAASEGQIAATC